MQWLYALVTYLLLYQPSLKFFFSQAQVLLFDQFVYSVIKMAKQLHILLQTLKPCCVLMALCLSLAAWTASIGIYIHTI